jgi:hypothetical protein
MGWPANRCGEAVRVGETCNSTPAPAPPMPTPADPLAQLLAAVLAYLPQPRAWPRPRPLNRRHSALLASCWS